MFRSQILHLVKLLKNKADLTSELGRSCSVLESSFAVGRVSCAKDVHTSCTLRKDDSQDAKKGVPVDEQLRSAAVEAAKSVPGDWNKTADTLLSRLSARKTAQSQEQDIGSVQPQTSNTMLQDMKVQRSYERVQQDGRSARQEGAMPGQRFQELSRVSPDHLRRKQEVYTNILEVPRLGIFDADAVKSQAGQQKPVLGKGLWEEKDARLVKLVQGAVHRNAWEEQIEWTKQGKLWTFPIDNEADKHEERQYKFHEHVFLERHLGNDFPASGPIRKFMSLVCLGLSQSPWLTVPEKVEHIRWFVGYFREKQALLESTIPGEEGKMPNAG